MIIIGPSNNLTLNKKKIYDKIDTKIFCIAHLHSPVILITYFLVSMFYA